MLKLRIFTAAILIPLVILAILKLSPLYFALASMLVLALAVWEWTQLINLERPIERISYLCSILVLFALLVFYKFTILILIIIGCIFCLLALFFIIKLKVFKQYWSQHTWFKIILGYLVFLPSWTGMNLVHTYNPALLIFCLFIIWAADTGAYFAGRIWGKRPLASEISPKKTIEGLWGGLITAIIITFIGLFLFQFSFSQSLILLIGALLTAVASVVGDLFESLVKRQANIKDSGSILPGHGGILDRLDSLTLAMPVFALVIYLIQP